MGHPVLPNLMRGGLVPERLVDGFLAQGFRVDLDAGKVDDIHSFHADTQAMREVFAGVQVDFSDAAQVSAAFETAA